MARASDGELNEQGDKKVAARRGENESGFMSSILKGVLMNWNGSGRDHQRTSGTKRMVL